MARKSGACACSEVAFIHKHPNEVRQAIGRVFQRANPLVTKSIFDNVAIGLAIVGVRNSAELRRVVKGLWQLLPEDSEARKKAYDSGVR